MTKVSSEIKQNEYKLWVERFPGLKFISKSRLSKIFGPFLISLEFGTHIDNYKYEPFMIIWLLSSRKRGSVYSWDIKTKDNKRVEFVYYPLNESDELIKDRYTKFGFQEPDNQEVKVAKIKKLDTIVFDFSKDLKISSLEQQLELNKSHDPFEHTYRQTVGRLGILIYAYLYYGNFHKVETLYAELDVLLKQFEAPVNGFSMPYDGEYMSEIRYDINNRDEFLSRIHLETIDTKYSSIEKAELTQ